MWIRSQNKWFLIKATEIWIDTEIGEYGIYALRSSDGGIYTLGIYGTEEEAIKILNNMQHFINNKHYDKVYEMPN